MLMHLSVKNLALIDEINLDFGPGFNILTGETGAGKSIIIDAVNLVLGERADRDLIQTGKEFALVEAVFNIDKGSGVEKYLDELGIQIESDGTLLFMRELTSTGRNICRINGRIVTLSTLKNISQFLVDVHGQHQHQSLLKVEQHMELLDMIGGEEISKIKGDLSVKYDKWKDMQRRIKKISGIGLDGERRKDILLYQINEIENADLKDGEEEELNREKTLLVNGEKITNTINSSYEDLYTGSNNQSSITDLLGRILWELGQIVDMDEGLGELYKKIESLSYQIEDITLELRGYKDGFEFDPSRLDEIENRLELIRNLKRKYGSSISDIMTFFSDIKTELNELENNQFLLNDLRKKEEAIILDLFDKSKILSNKRKEIAGLFEKELLSQLMDLGMDKASFEVNIDNPGSKPPVEELKGSLSPRGYDKIEFLISTNPGEPVKPLSKIISGGEMSRIMLGFKTILAKIDDIDTLIFDEIDVGISGRIANSVAEKMGKISKTRQVICVTHLPQIAAMADIHYRVHKSFLDGHTMTQVQKLDVSGRQKEIAVMIGGKDLTKASMEHSLELITAAEGFKSML